MAPTRRSLLCGMFAASTFATQADAIDTQSPISITADAAAAIADILRAKGLGIGMWPDGMYFVARVGTLTLAPNRTATSGFIVQRNGKPIAGLHEIANTGDIVTISVVRIHSA